MLIGDAKSAYSNKQKNRVDTAVLLSKQLFQSIGSFCANIYGGGFAGVSNFSQLKAAISAYARKTNSAIASYNANARIESTFKGKAADECRTFIGATKELLKAYVDLVQKWNDELRSRKLYEHNGYQYQTVY